MSASAAGSEAADVDTSYDVLVIGGGAAGENAAALAARGDLRVGLIEHELVGGECTYWACVPSKALLRPGAALAALRRVPGARAAAARGDIDLEEALRRRDALAARWDDTAQVDWLDGAGVDLIRGHGRLVGDRALEVEGPQGDVRRYEVARAVVVATGSSASFPPIPGLDDVGAWTSRDITTAREVPRRLLVIGGGAVGVEMAQAWRWLGSDEVTVLETSDHLLSDEEPFAGDELEASLSRMGVTVHTSATTTAIERGTGDTPVVASVEPAGGRAIRIGADRVLVATGRRPNTTTLGVEAVGLEPGAPIDVDDHLRATAVHGGWLYAVGDVNGRSLFTHTGKYQARIAGAHIAGLDTAAWGDRVAVPRVAFTDPQVAAVGLTEALARERGIDVRTVRYDIGELVAATTLGEGYGGTCQLVVDAGRGVLVGATFVGPSVGELLHAATVAIVAEVPLETLWHAVPAFPTLGEVWLRLLEAYRDAHGATFT